MKAVRCKNKQCGEPIAVINGPVRWLDCLKCGTRNKIYSGGKGIRLEISVKK